MSDLSDALPPLTLEWSEDALTALRRVPFVVRKAAVRGVEAYALTKGVGVVTEATMQEARAAREAAEASGTTTTQHAPGQGGAFPTPERDLDAPVRQFVSFGFFKVDPAWRRLPLDQRARHKAEFADVYDRHAKAGTVICRSYSTVGIRADADLMLWRISTELDAIQDMTAELLRTGIGGWLAPSHNLLGMTKQSQYADKLHPEHEGARLRIVPGRARYIFVYPFVKTREWYLMTQHARQGIMDEHIFVGTRYSRVKLNTTYSFGIDDQDFLVAFETNHPGDFVDLVQELRETESSRFTVRDTPIFTCIARPMPQALDLLG
ncbi:MAG: chlorite dismutase family protein [Myxococcales bacterium]|jgi:chlorite dismutase